MKAAARVKAEVKSQPNHTKKGRTTTDGERVEGEDGATTEASTTSKGGKGRGGGDQRKVKAMVAPTCSGVSGGRAMTTERKATMREWRQRIDLHVRAPKKSRDTRVLAARAVAGPPDSGSFQ
jgi:hypothetical protein